MNALPLNMNAALEHDETENVIAGPGHNNPPLTPFEVAKKEIDDLYSECRLWLDGAVVNNQDLADGIGNLVDALRKAHNKAEALRVEEKTPFDEAINEIQGRYNPLISENKKSPGLTMKAIAACKAALNPWLEKLRLEQEAIAAKAREEALAKQRAAEEATRAADRSNLEQVEAAEALIKEAKAAERFATKAENAKPQAGGMSGRSIGLKTVWYAEMTDETAALKHYWTTRRAELVAYAQTLADQDVRAGKHSIPGFDVKEKKEAV